MMSYGLCLSIGSSYFSKKLIVNRLLIILSIVSPTFMVSCANRGAGDPLSIPYVKSILSDTTTTVYNIVKNAGESGSNGVISIIGPANDAMFISDEFLCCDHFDNVNGRMVSDGLPDFSGETISVVCDEANSPYHGYVEKQNESYLKELNVKNFINVVDTSCFLSPYDKEDRIGKNHSKVVVLSSSYSSAFGYSDIMALVNGTRADIDVISPIHSMFRYAMKRHGGENASIAVWTSEQILGDGVYSALSSELEKEYPSLKYDMICPQHGGTIMQRMLSFFRMYRSAGQRTRLDVVLVDDIPMRADSLNSIFHALLAESNDSLMTYKAFLSDNFEFIDARTSMVADCISYLRKMNGFTHRVAYPAMEMFAVVPVPDLAVGYYYDDGRFSDDFKYNRAPGSELESFLTVEMNERYMSEDQISFMKSFAQKTYEEYVSK